MSRMQGKRPPEIVEPVDPTPPIKLSPNSRFLLKAHKERFCVLRTSDGRGHVVPQLGKQMRVPGVANVDRRGGMRKALSLAKSRGWTVIPEDVRGPGTSYLRLYDTEAGPDTLWATEWEIFYPGSKHIDSDMDGYVEFLQWLVDEGHVEPAPDYVLERMRKTTEKTLAEFSDKAIASPSYKEQVRHFEEDLRAINEEIERRRAASDIVSDAGDDDDLDEDAEGPPATKPSAKKPKRRRGKKPAPADDESDGQAENVDDAPAPKKPTVKVRG